MTDRSVKVRLSAENAAFMRGMQESGRSVADLSNRLTALERDLDRVDGRTVKVTAKLDRAAFDAELRRAGSASARVSLNAGLDTSSWRDEARRAAALIDVKVKASLALGSTRLTAAIRAEFEAGTKQRLQAQLDAMRLSVKVTPKVGVLGGSSGGGGGFNLPGISAAGAGIAGLLSSAPQLTSLLSASAAAAAALASQLGLAASAGAGLVPIFGSLAQGLGVLAVGTSGIRDVFKQYTSEQNAGAAATSGQASATRAAANSIVSAREAVTRAQEASSRSIQSAIQQQVMAERNLSDAQIAATKAQQDLSDARKQAQMDLEDLTSQAAGGLLSQREDVLALQDAKATLAQTPIGTEEYQKAQIAVDRATLALSDQQRENARLADQQKLAQQQGIDGSKGVVAAQDAVTAAVRNVGDAQQGVAQANQDLNRAQVDGARSVADAQRALVQAQEAFSEATNKTSSSVSKYNEALSKLGPNQRAFVAAALASKGALMDLKSSVGEALFAGLDKSLGQVTTGLLPMFKTQLTDTASILNRTGKSLVDDLVGPLKGPLTSALKINNDLMAAGSPIIGNLASAFLSVYQAAAPLARRIVDSATGLSGFLATASGAGLASGGLTRFFNEAGDRAAALIGTVKNVGLAIYDVLKIGNEGSGGMLTSLENLSKRFLDFTRSATGKNDIRVWFDDGRAAASAFGDLIKQIGVSFKGIGDGGGPTEIVDALRRATPEIAAFVKSLADGGSSFRTLASSILDIGAALNKMNIGGALAGIVSVVATFVTAVADIVNVVPGAATAVGALATAFATMRIAGKLSFIPTGLTAQIKGLSGAFMALANQMMAMFPTLGVNASMFAAGLATLGGAAAVVGIVELAKGWSDAKKIIRDAAQSISDSYRLINTGSSSASLQKQIDAQKESLDGLLKTYRDYKNASWIKDFNPFHWDNVVAGIGAGKKIGDARQALDDLRGTMDGYNNDLLRVYQTQMEGTSAGSALAGNLALTGKAFEDFKDTASAAGITTGDSFQSMQDKLATYQQQAGTASVASLNLSRDMDTLRDSTSSASDKADALTRVLKGLNGGAADAQTAAINQAAAFDALTASLKQNGKGLDENTAAGRSNGQALIAAKQALDDRVAAMVKAGATEADITKVYGDGTDALNKQVIATAATKDEVARYQAVLGLTPPAKATEMQVIGDLVAAQKVQSLQDQLNNIGKNYDASITVGVNGVSGSAFGQSLQGKLASLQADGSVLDFYANGGMRENHVAQIAPAGAWRVWAEDETGGEAYIPLSPAKRVRSLQIWQETGRRMGALGGDIGKATFGDEKHPVRTFANGAISVTETADTSNAMVGIPDVLTQALKALQGIASSVAQSVSGLVTGAGGGNMADFLRKHLNVPYSWGGGTDSGPSRGFAQGANTIGWDCSSFMKYGAWNALGIHIPRTASAQQAALAPAAGPAPGELVFYGGSAGRGGAHHVGLVSGPGTMIEEPHTGSYSREVAFRPGSSYATLGSARDALNYNLSQQSKLASIAEANGGILNPHIRDSGGPLLPGYTYNGTGAPEAVEWVRGPGRSSGGSVQSSAPPAGGQFTGTLVLSSGEFLGYIDGRMDQGFAAAAAESDRGVHA